jgi:hypothetical protein
MSELDGRLIGRLCAWLTLLGWALLIVLVFGPFKDALNATQTGRSFGFLLVVTTGLSMFGSWVTALSATSGAASARFGAARATLWKYPLISGVWFWLRHARP